VEIKSIDFGISFFEVIANNSEIDNQRINDAGGQGATMRKAGIEP
tara:strand:+ start:733 stop:867 length:135 start_codon:yes stop_codon:yes gene_type:complete